MHFRARRFPSNCFLVHLHGAVTRVPVAATAFPLRKDRHHVDVSAHWKPLDGQRAASEWIEALKTKLPVDEDGNYVNVMEREGENSVRHAYGVNYARVAATQSPLRSTQPILPEPEHTARMIARQASPLKNWRETSCSGRPGSRISAGSSNRLGDLKYTVDALRKPRSRPHEYEFTVDSTIRA